MVEDKPYSYAKDELQDVVMGKKCHCGHLEEMIEEMGVSRIEDEFMSTP